LYINDIQRFLFLYCGSNAAVPGRNPPKNDKTLSNKSLIMFNY